MIGHNPTLFFSVDNCRETYFTLLNRGVTFISPPQDLPFGVQAMAEDMDGNHIVLLEPWL